MYLFICLTFIAGSFKNKDFCLCVCSRKLCQTMAGGKKKDVPLIQDSLIRTDFKSNFLENKKLQSNGPHTPKYPQTCTGKTENKG